MRIVIGVILILISLVLAAYLLWEFFNKQEEDND